MKEIESLKNRLQMENTYLQEEIKLSNNFDEIVARVKHLVKETAKWNRLVTTDATVPLLEKVAPKRTSKPGLFTISANAVKTFSKNQLRCFYLRTWLRANFGHEKGAFRATERKMSFWNSDGGTIFLTSWENCLWITSKIATRVTGRRIWTFGKSADNEKWMFV